MSRRAVHAKALMSNWTPSCAPLIFVLLQSFTVGYVFEHWDWISAGHFYCSSSSFSMLAVGNYSQDMLRIVAKHLWDIAKKQEWCGSLVTVAPLGETHAENAWWYVDGGKRRTTATTACLHFLCGSVHSQGWPSSMVLCVLLMQSPHFGMRSSHVFRSLTDCRV